MNPPTADSTVEILSYRPDLAADFARINYEWLEEFFEVEAKDREILENPQAAIIDGGGQIFFARVGEAIVGTVALIAEENETFELAKMGVTGQSRGLGVGRRLIQHAIDYSRAVGKSRIVLESNRKLEPAIALYSKCGFTSVESQGCSEYVRCDIRMELSLQ